MLTVTALPLAVLIAGTAAAWAFLLRPFRGADHDGVDDRRRIVRGALTAVAVYSMTNALLWAAVFRPHVPRPSSQPVEVAVLACDGLTFVLVTAWLAGTLRTRAAVTAAFVSSAAVFGGGLVRVLLGALGMRGLLILDTEHVLFETAAEQLFIALVSLVPAAVIALVSWFVFRHRPSRHARTFSRGW